MFPSLPERKEKRGRVSFCSLQASPNLPKAGPNSPMAVDPAEVSASEKDGVAGVTSEGSRLFHLAVHNGEALGRCCYYSFQDTLK